MQQVSVICHSVYAFGLILALTINHNSILAQLINPISTNNLFQKLSIDDGDDFEDNENDNLGYIEHEKRDVIKGPSFIPNIDASTADSEIAYENDEVSEEGSRRLNIGAPFRPDQSRYIKPKNNIEDNLDSIETLMKDDSDTWESTSGNPIKSISHHVHHDKTNIDGNPNIVDENAAKKDTFSKVKHDDDLPNKVIKALYDWKVDVTKGYSRSNVLNVSDIDKDLTSTKSTIKSSESSKSSDTANPATSEEISSPLGSDNDNSNTKPFLTEDGFSVDERANAEPVIPAHSMTPSTGVDVSPVAKKRKKINLLVNVNINEAPGRRSKVGNSHRLGSSFFSLSAETESPEKRNFPYYFHHRRGLKFHHKPLRPRMLKKHLKEDAESGEGSGSGGAEIKPYFPEVYANSNVVPIKTPQESSIVVSTNSANAVIPNVQESTSTHVEQEYIDNKATEVNTGKKDTNEIKVKNNLENQYNYDSYHGDKTEDDDNEASGSGHVLTFGGKDANNKDLSYKAKVILGYSEAKNETDRNVKSPNKENENIEREQTLKPTPKENESQYAARNTEVKEDETPDIGISNEIATEQHEEKTDNTEHNEAIESNKEQQVSEVHKEDTDQSDKTKTLSFNQTNQLTQNDDVMINKKEESGNTDGTDNMKKKTGQEDKYETLEEVREKFKKWESNIIKRPSEMTVSDETNPVTKLEQENTDTVTKPDESSNLSSRPEESNTAASKIEESVSTAARSDDNSNVATKTEETNDAVTKPDINASTKPEGSHYTAVKPDESTNAVQTMAEVKPKKVAEQTEEKKVKEKTEVVSEKKVNPVIKADIVTDKEGEDKPPEEAIIEKPPDDFVKELIGIPAKQTHQQKAEVKENTTPEATIKSSQDTKQEKETEGGKVVSTSDKSSKGGEEEKGGLSKLKTPRIGEDKFNMEEVNKKNKEHHDIPDSDMKVKEETPEKVNLKAEEVSKLNASDVPGIAEQTTSEEKPITETSASPSTTSALEEKSVSQETPSDDKTLSQAPAAEEKAHVQPSVSEEKVATSTSTAEPVKQVPTIEEKPLTQTASIETTKQTKQQAATEEKPVKQTSTVEKKPKKQQTPSEDKSVKSTKETNEFTQDQDKTLKKTTTEEPEGSTEFTIDQEKTLTNPLIAKEANEFSNEQEKSFASAIERIKAQEEKLKGKEISSEIQEIKERKGTETDTDVHTEVQEKFNKDNDEEPISTAKTKKRISNLESKKPSEKNLKQLRLYKHQILSEVEKIDDLMSEYQKDGHSTKELSEAKEVLENDLKLVKELERNTKKKTSAKKEKEKEKQVMPSSAYLNTLSDESKVEMTHRDKPSLESKSFAKSLEKEPEKSDKQLENLIPSYEYYFHSEAKPQVKKPRKQSLEEIHRLLKAEIKRLKQKKNGKADNQLKNIRKLVQQHLKKLISTGDIDKTAFHSLAPEIKQLGELLKERIKSLKKKKIARKIKVRKFKENMLIQTLKPVNKKPNEVHEQPTETQVFNNEVKIKGGKKSHHQLALEPKITNPDKLDPPLESVKGVESSAKLSAAHNPTTSTTAHETSHETSALSDEKVTSDKVNDTVSSVTGENSKSPAEGNIDPAQSINIKNLLKTLNEKLGSVYQKAKDAHDVRFSNNLSNQASSETSSHQEQPQPQQQQQQQQTHHSSQHEPDVAAVATASNQQYTAPKPAAAAAHVNTANVVATTLHSGDQRQNVETVNSPPVIDVTEPQAAAVPANTGIQQAMATPPANPLAAETNTPSVEDTFQATQPISVQPESAPNAESKNDLPMVPEEPEFEEDNTEALASLEPINTLVETLEKDITELWSYKDLYSNAEALGLDNEKVHNTYANLGSLSGLSLRRALNRALRGEDVGLGVVGGSISKGGPFSEKGLEYVLRSYFYAIEDYWNKVIRPITGSSMIVRDVSLGGISTDYYSFCIRNHLPDDKLTNIVLWELSANDMRRYDDSLKPKPQPLEQFTRNVLSYRAKPSLIFVNFFALFDWDPDLRANCRNFEDEGEDDVAKYYKITSLSWRNMVCPLLKSETSPIFTRNNLFAEDHFHPSILGHAQMSYIIIDYIRTEFLKNLVKMRPFFIGDAVEKLQIPRSVYMPRPMFKETFLWKPLCYTYMLVDNRLPNNTMPLHEENESDFKYTVVRGFKIRSDKIAGMETKLKDQFIRYKLQIPRHEDGGLAPFKQLGIMSFTDDRYAEIQFDSQHPTRLEAKKRFLEGTVVKTIAENIEPGEHTLTVRSGDSGFLICALVLG